VTLYLRDATMVDWRDGRFSTGHWAVEAGATGTLHPVDNIPTGAESLDCSGKWVTHALVVGHHHVYSTLARGMPAPPTTPTNFVEILKYVWWRLDKRLDRDMIRTSALACAVDAARSGSTFVIDHHASPCAVQDSLHLIAEAFDQVGVSHLLCYELSDRDGPDARAQGLAETDRYLAHRPGLVGLHASFTVSDSLLEEALALVHRHNTGLHVHVAEAEADQDHCLETYGKRVLERFHEAGALGSSKTILAHCIHLNTQERQLLRNSPIWVVQNAESNLNNGVGRFDGTGLGARIFLGTDGMHSDMLASARVAFLTGQPHTGMDEVYARLRRTHHYLAENEFVGDGENNLVVLEYLTPTPVTEENWLGHLFFALNRSHIQHVISDGRLIVKDRQVITVDEEAIAREAQVQARRLWARLKG